MSISKKKAKKTASLVKTPQQELVLHKQMLADLERRISMSLGNYLVLTEEGDPTQIAMAQQMAKSVFFKFGSLNAQDGPSPGRHPFPLPWTTFSIASIQYCTAAPTGWTKQEKISRCYHTTQHLESELQM